MNILVTGNEGFIGKRLCQKLIEAGHTVEGFEYKENVLPDPSAYDWVIHLGAISSTTETDVEKIMNQNFEFTMQLINLCDQFGVNLQYSSSAGVYGPLDKEKFKEDDPCLPKSPYAWTKYLIDRWLLGAGLERGDFSVLIQGFRYFNVYGPGEEHKGDQASPLTKFEKQAKEAGSINILEGSENYLRDFVHVDDVCDAHIQMLNADTNGIYNVGTGKTESFANIANWIAKKHDATVNTIPLPNNLQGQYQNYTCADITRLNKHVNKQWKTVKEYIDEQ